MAVAVDASTPARWSAVLTMGGAGSASASFTPPDNSFIVLTAQMDSQGSNNPVTTISGGSLTWTSRVARADTESAGGGHSEIWTARVTTGASMTITLTWNSGSGADTSRRWSMKAYVLTGVDVDGTPFDTIGANNEGTSSTNNINTTGVTPGANGLLIASDAEWNERGAFQAPSDGSTQDTTTYTGELSVCSAYRTCISGVSVTMNLNAGGTSAAQHKWCQIIIREAAGGGGAVIPAASMYYSRLRQ